MPSLRRRRADRSFEMSDGGHVSQQQAQAHGGRSNPRCPCPNCRRDLPPPAHSKGGKAKPAFDVKAVPAKPLMAVVKHPPAEAAKRPKETLRVKIRKVLARLHKGHKD